MTDRAAFRQRLSMIAILAGLSGGLMLIGCLVPRQDPSIPARQPEPLVIELHDRDMESWAGHRYGERLALDGVRLSVALGSWQRFNAAVYASRSLSNVNLYLTMPTAIDVKPSLAWTLQRHDWDAQVWSAHLGPINAGERINAQEAFYFGALVQQRSGNVPRSIAIDYLITAQELQKPARGRIWIYFEDKR